jgi:DNA-binding transcriptional ArsR family regulator
MILTERQEGSLTIEFIYSPFFEMICSLHVLTKPEHHLGHLNWAEGMLAKLPQPLHDDILYFGTNFSEWLGVMGFSFAVDPSINDLNITAIIEEMGNMPAHQFMKILTNDKQKLPLDDNEVESLRFRLIACLKVYYFQFFEKELRYIEPLLIRILKRQACEYDHIGMKAYLKTLHNRIDVIDDKLIFYKYRTFTVDMNNIQKLSLRISSFIDPHLLISISDTSHVKLTYRARLQESVQLVPEDLFRTAKALGDKTRLKILRAIRQKQCSTQSLAKELQLTEACISKHLQILHEAELLYKQRKGNYVYYLLNHMLLEHLPQNIYQYLDG